MIKLSAEQIRNIYDMVKQNHGKYLEASNVKMPSLYKGKTNEYTKDALVLVYLAYGYPKTRIVSKDELTQFIREFDSEINDVQQARHLAAQKGWFIASGTRNDSASENLKPGEYRLETLEKPYPGFTAARRDEFFDGDEWEGIKAAYEYRCACCGSKEGEKHRYMKNVKTRLQKGHKNPNKPLTKDNIIPQCDICNRADRNYWEYDSKGRVIKVANAKVIDRCSKELKKEIYKKLYYEFDGKKPEFL